MAKRRRVLERLIGPLIRDTDFTDDRLSDDRLWQVVEADLANRPFGSMI